MPDPRGPESHDGSKCCRFVWRWLRGQSLLPTRELQQLWGSRGGLEDRGLHGSLGQPWGHGRSFSGQSRSRGQQITRGCPYGLALPFPPSWCCASLGSLQERCCPPWEDTGWERAPPVFSGSHRRPKAGARESYHCGSQSPSP